MYAIHDFAVLPLFNGNKNFIKFFLCEYLILSRYELEQEKMALLFGFHLGTIEIESVHA